MESAGGVDQLFSGGRDPDHDHDGIFDAPLPTGDAAVRPVCCDRHDGARPLGGSVIQAKSATRAPLVSRQLTAQATNVVGVFADRREGISILLPFPFRACGLIEVFKSFLMQFEFFETHWKRSFLMP